jgi:hypothetical protein
MKGSFRKCVGRLTWALAGVLFVISSSLAGEIKNGHKAVFALVDRLVSSPPINHTELARVTGLKLTLSSSNGYFSTYDAGKAAVSDSEVTVLLNYREPIAGGNAKAGPILVLKLSGDCISLQEVSSRYAELDITGFPSVHSLQSQTYYGRRESWGTFSFGFSQVPTECLRTVVFNLPLPGEAPSFSR